MAEIEEVIDEGKGHVKEGEINSVLSVDSQNTAREAAASAQSMLPRRKLKVSNFCTLGIMLLLRFTKTDIDKYVTEVRIGFCAAFLLNFAMFALVRRKVELENQRRKAIAKNAELQWNAALSKRREPRKKSSSKKANAATKGERKQFEETIIAKKSPDWGEDEVDTEMTISEYDLWQLSQRRNNQLFVLAIMAFMHLKLKYTAPMLMNIATTICSLFEDPMIAIFLRGKEAVGDLARPWASNDPLDALAGGSSDTATSNLRQVQSESTGVSREEQDKKKRTRTAQRRRVA